jgi:general stress protein YciG
MPDKSQNKGQRQDDAPGSGREGKPVKSTRGFAAMDPQRQRDIASEGGRAAHEQGKAHKFTPDEAREAGRKGGMASGAARASRSKARAASQAGPNGPASGGEHPANAPRSEESGGMQSARTDEFERKDEGRG